jgi:hypothetical protein
MVLDRAPGGASEFIGRDLLVAVGVHVREQRGYRDGSRPCGDVHGAPPRQQGGQLAAVRINMAATA